MQTSRRGFFGVVAGAVAAAAIPSKACPRPLGERIQDAAERYRHVEYGYSFKVSPEVLDGDPRWAKLVEYNREMSMRMRERLF